jgi:hypothetical protein
MATEMNFEGRRITLPGVYSTIKSGIKNPPISLPYGNVLLIDTGSGAGYGGGAGINGELASGQDVIYPIDNIADFRTTVKGGYWYTLAKPLFKPLNSPGVNGISTLYYVRAATTIASTMTFNPEGTIGGYGAGIGGGTFVVKCRDEGVIGNGSLTDGELRKGYAFKLSAGVLNPAKFIMTFYLGTFTGLAGDGFPYGDVIEVSSNPKVVAKSREFTDMADLIDWATNDSGFQNYFNLASSTIVGIGDITADDLVDFSTYQLAIGGTESFDSDDLAAALEAVATLRYSFLLSDKFGDDAQDVDNDTLLSHVLDINTSFEKMIFIGGGSTSSKFTQTNGSIPIAQHFDSDRVVVVHGGVKVDSSITPNKIREWDSLYNTVAVLGRIAGLAPQTPGTFKILPYSGLLHQLTNSEKEQGLKAGVLMVHYDTQLLNPAYTILQAVNSLQDNINMINENGTSNEISIRRIASQLNLELTINARRDLLGQEAGPNLKTLSDRTIIDWMISQLQSHTATATEDDMIIAFQNISVKTNQDSKFVTYEFKPNSPVNKFFMTGFMVN